MGEPRLNRQSPIEALLLVSFGGPEGPDEVMPFLERVTAGRGVPPERLQVVAQHYFDRGGVSPINGQCRDLVERLEEAFSLARIAVPIYWGNRNSAPFLEDTVAQMTEDGIGRAAAFVTSAYSSYSGCRQYREDIERARRLAGPSAPLVDKLRVFFNHPGFIEPLIDGLGSAWSEHAPAKMHVFFTAHSIPLASAQTCDYEAQVANAASLVAAGAQAQIGAQLDWSIAWQSRSGPPSMKWLEPDIGDAIEGLGSDVEHVIVVPIGFISDHMEVISDLDTVAAAVANSRGLGFSRVSTSSTDDRFVAMVVALLNEQREGTTPVALGRLGLVPEQCNATCCPAPRRPARRSRPVA